MRVGSKLTPDGQFTEDMFLNGVHRNCGSKVKYATSSPLLKLYETTRRALKVAVLCPMSSQFLSLKTMGESPLFQIVLPSLARTIVLDQGVEVHVYAGYDLGRDVRKIRAQTVDD